ncbi:MAG: beta strand repeat-containing protein, partial [Bacteroidota bacterium]
MTKTNFTSSGSQGGFWRWLKALALTLVVALLSFTADAQNVLVTATAGTTSGSYATVSAAFAAINAGTHQGTITLQVVANTTEPATPTALTKSGPTSNYSSVLITPFGGNYTISGAATPTANRAIIELSGADNVTIDGDDPTITGTRNLTIAFPSTSATIASCIRVSSNSTLGADGASNNTIKNCIITGNRISTGTTVTYGINMSNYSTTSSSTGGYASLNNRFENNVITRCYHGIWAVGGSSTYPNNGLQIINNVLGDGTSAGNIGLRGIIMSNTSANEAGSAIVRGNEVVGVGDPGTTGYAASIAGMEIGTVNFGAKIYNNYVHDVKQPSTGGYGAYGVLFSGATSCDSMRFYNNIITRITASNYIATALSSFTNYGVKMTAGPTFGDFSNNTIVLSTANPTGTLANPISYALSCDVNGVRLVNFRNNIIVNTNASTNAIGMYVNSNAIYTSSNYTGGQIWDKNCYWVPSGILGYSAASTPQTTFSAWKTAVGKDGTSFNINPSFVSATDLHINGSVASLLESGGMATSFNTDFDGQGRPGPAGSVNGGATAFDIGADEFDGIPIIPISITSASATANSCSAIAHTVTATVVQGTNAITSVVLSYTLNGTAQTPITMTNTSGNTWEATIPAASPTNATIAWTVTATDAVAAPTSTGSYQDDALNGIGVTTSANPAAVCLGATSTLAASFYNPTAAPTNYTIQAVTNPTTDEDLGNVTITDAATSTVILNNTSTINSLVGTLGTATGTAGSYASYLTLATVPMTAGSTYNFSLSSLQGATAYGNAMAIYIDFNRDGDYADAGENVYVAAATTSGAHTETGSFTIPATANNGLTRMRVIVNEGLVSSPTMAISYGEREEYMVNISSANNGGGGNIPAFTYSWSDGTSALGTTNPYVATVNGNTTYTITASTTAGCTISGSSTVTTIALPSAPTATNSVQCGSGVPTASVASNTGLATPQYVWYAAETGGTALQSSSANTYGTSISSTTTLYVSENDGTCQSLRTPVTVTVNTPPAITTSGPATICSGQSTALFVISSNPGYAYSWSGGLGTGANVTASPLTTTTYTVTALDTTTGEANSGCTISASLVVTVNASPLAITITPTPAAICEGGSSTLNTVGGYNEGSYISGGLTTVNATTGYPAPFTNYYGGTKTQWMYTAAELTALGYAPGDQITSLGLAVSAVGSTFTGTLNGFTVALKNAGSLSALTSTFETGLTQVASLNWTVPTTGLPIWSLVTFPTPFTWTGGALVVQTSYSNGNSGTSTDFVQTYLTNTGSNYASYYRVDGATAATVLAATAATTTTNRPDTRFGWRKLASWSWSPVTSSASSVTVSPTSNTTYSAIATNLAGCTASASASVTVNPLPNISGTTTDVLCNGGSTGSITASASGSTSPYTYTLNGGSSNSTGLFSGLAAGTYAVATTDANSCSKTTNLTINQPTACTVSGTATNVTCNGLTDGSVSFSAAGGVAPYTYTLNGTAATSPVAGLGAGSYVVISTDANGCTATTTITVSQPEVLSATATPASASTCPSTTTSVTVAATGGTAPYTGTGSFNQGVGTQSYTVTDANGCSTSASASVSVGTYTITASAGANGSISDAGANTVNCEDNKSFTITPNSCYSIADVLVNGVSVGAVSSYTFTNVSANNTIDASFAIITYTITATAASGGTITASSTQNCGASVTYTVTPDPGYQVDSIIVNGVTTSYPAATLTASQAFNNISANNTIAAYFSAAPCTTPALASAPATASICSGLNYTLNGSISGTATSGTWSSSGTGSFDNTAFGTGTIYTPSAADIAAGSVTLTLTTDDPDGAGPCSAASVSTVITINTTPSVTISGNTAYCAGGSTSLTASGADSYVWSTTATTATITATAGTYSVVGTAANGCTASASITVIENALPAAPVVSASGATTFCTGGSVTLTSDYVGGNTWSNGATTDAITVSTSGSYSVTYTDVNGCSATSAATAVTVNTSSVAITGATTYCIGGATTLTATATPAAVSYAWSFNSTATDTTSTTSANAVGVYSVTTTDANGCTATSNVTVSEAPAFTVSVTGDCSTWVAGNTNVLTATPSIAGTFTYSWNGGLGTAATANATLPGTYTATVSDQYGCTATGSFTFAGSALNGTYSIGAGCGSFPTVASAITHLNNYGVSGNVTINVPAGYTETAPAGGYQLKMCALAANLQTGPTQTLTIEKSGSGANPVLTAPVGASTTIDGIFVITGADNVTINGINLTEAAGNTTATTRMEWGYAVLKCDGNNGANDVTITNCNIALAAAFTAGNGIYVANHDNLSTTGFTNSTYTTTAQAARNKVSITNNTINNCYTGIRLGANPNVVSTTGECLNDTLNNISNNTITNFGGAATSAYGIYYGNNRQITIRSNTISSSTTATSTTSGGIYALSGTWATICGNTIQNIVSSSTFYGIYHALAGGDATNPNIVRIDSNIIQTCTPTAGSFYGIYGTSTGGTSAQVSTSYNEFRNHTWATTSTATMYGMYQFLSGTNMVFNCKYNLVYNNTLQNTNTFYGIYGYATNGTFNCQYNTIRNNILSPSSGTSYILYASSSNETHMDYNNITNNRRNVLATATSVGTTYGIYALSGSTLVGSVNNNVIDTLYSKGVPGTLTSLTYGLYFSGNMAAGSTINNNVVRNISIQGTSTGNQTIYGSYFAPSGSGNIIKGNRVARIGTTTSTTGISTDAQFGGSMNSFVVGAQLAGSTTAGVTKFFDGNTFNTLVAGGSNGIARGIWATTGQDWYIYNNAISRVNAPFASPATAPTASSSTTVTTGTSVHGIDIANATAGYNFYVYNNTVNLSGNGGGPNFASSGIHTNATPNVTLVNNLVINNINSGTSQASVAFRRSGVLSATYQSASDNNLFYAGTPGANKLIYGEGVGLTTNSKQTLADFKTYVGPTRDANSRTETSTPFVSSTTDSLLHIDATTATFVEGGGKPYPATALTTDIDGQTRNLTAPDIGADEGNFVGLLPTIVSVSAAVPSSQCSAVDHVVTVVTGSSVTGVNLNYSLNGTAQTPLAMSNGGAGTTWTVTIPAATPVNAVVTYSATATDGTYSVSANGPSSYQDAYLTGFSLTGTTSSTAICAGSSVNLNAYIAGPQTAPTYGAANATSTADEEILGVTFGTLSSTSSCTTTGGPGSTLNQYSNYTASVQAPLIVAGQAYSFSVTVGTCGGNYSNRSVIYIDWNRDGDYLDANEQTAEPAAVSGPHVWTGTITAPANLSPGKTGMRVITNETSTITAPTGTFSWGEVEDYYLNLAGGAGFTYTWSDGTSTVFTGTGTFTPSAAGSYSLSATGTDPNGCALFAAPVTFTVSDIPPTPTATASSQCGTGIPAIKVSGAVAGTGYNWYLTSTGGTAIQSSPVDSLTSYTINSTTTFYVATQLNSIPFCESPRTAVIATVITPDSVSISGSANNVCPGTVVTLTANQIGSTNTYAYTWNGAGLNATTGNPVTATIAGVSNTFNVTAVDATLGCTTTATITIAGVTPPSITGSSATPSVICAGSPTTLLATTTVIGTGPQIEPSGYPASNATSTADEEILNVTFKSINQSSTCSTLAPGTGSLLNQYSNYTSSVSAPSITTNEVVSFSVQIGTCGGNYTNRSVIYIDWNRDGDFLDANETAATEPAGVSGPHIWTGSLTVPSSASPGVTRMRVITNETSAVTASNVTYTWGETEDYIVNVLAPVQEAGTYTWSWSDGSSVVGTGNSIVVNPTAPTTYTVTATDPATGCTSTVTVTPTVNPLPAAPTATNSVQCGAGIPTASVASTSGLTSPGFNWYLTATGGTAVQSSFATTLSSYSISNTTTFYVSEVITATGCESPRTAVEVTVNQPDSVAVTASVASANNCLGTTVTLTATNVGTTNTYAYTWNGSLSSGILSPTSGSTITVTPTAAGTYTYSLTAVDAAAGCQRVVNTNVTINANPAIDSVSVSPSAVCSGQDVTLRAYALSAGPQTQPIGYPASNATSTDDEEILAVTFKTLAQSSSCTTTGGAGSILNQYSDYTGVSAPVITLGETVNFSVQIGTCGGNYTNRSVIYIDWNRDGDFLDANETAATEPASAVGPHTWSGTVVVPATAQAGITRMRVITNETSAVTASNVTYTWGETEDYLVNIIGLSDGGATTSWVWNPGAIAGNIATATPTASVVTNQSYVVTATNAAGCTTQNTVSVTVNPNPDAPTAIDGTICGFNLANVAVTSNSGLSTPSYIWHLEPTGNTSIISGQTGSSLSNYYLSVTDTFYVQEQNLATGCNSARIAVIQNVTQPDAITAASSASSICLPDASITLSATQTGSTNNYTYNWTAVPPVGSGLSGVQLGPVTTLFSNDFSNSTLPSNVTVVGSATITGGVLQVTPNALSQSGGVKITAGGNAADTIAVDFDLIVPQNGADGVSYSYSDDGVEGVQATMNSENGTGSKLKLGFVSYTNGTSTNGIYLMYNCTTNEQTPSTSGVLAYSSNVSWRGSAAPVHVAYTVGSSGLFNLSLNGTPVFTDVQLPASYLSANKSNWNHIFKARTGGVSEEHSIDNMTVKVAQIQSLPTPGQNLTITPTLPGTYTYQVTGTDGACNAISTVTVVVNPAAPAINAGSDLTICEGGNVTLNSTSAGLIPALRFTESLWQVNAGTGATGAGIPAWASTWYTANGGTTNDMLEITNLGSGPAASAGVIIEFWNSASVTGPLYSYTIPSSAPLMASGGLLYFSHSGSPIISDATNNFYTNGQGLNNGSGTAGGWIMRKNGVIIDAMVVNSYSFPAASGVTASDWSGTLPSNSGLSGSILVAADNNTSSSWSNTSAALLASVGTLNTGLVANLPSLGTVSWSSIPSGFTGTQATSTFGPITVPTTFTVMFDNGSCQSYDTVVVTPSATPANPVIVSNKDSICTSGAALYTASNLTQGATLQWQTYDVATSTWVDVVGATSSTYTTPTYAPVNGDTTVYFRLATSCTNPAYSNVDTLQIVKPFITSTVGDTVCGGGTVDLVANGNGTMVWYGTSSSTTVLSTGTNYSPFILSNSVYWVRAQVGTCLDPAGRLPVISISNPAPVVTITPATASICEGFSTTLTASSTDTAYVYTWNGGLGTGATVTAAPTSTTTYNVVGTNPTTGCLGSASVTVTVNQTPSTPVITQSTAVACPGSSTTLTASSIAAGPQVAPTGYCAGSPSTVTFADEQIFGVTFGSMTNNQTENCSSNYSDYTSTIAPVTVNSGSSYPFSVITDECDGATYYSSGLSIYIDYNRDGDWDDAGEQAYTTSATTLSPNTRTGVVSIPSNASLGLTRMRVVVVESVASPTQCPTFSYGEMEDYLVNITGPSAAYTWSTGATTASISVTPPAGSTTYTVTATSAAGCTSATGSFTVTTNPAPSPVLTATDTTLCAPNSINI